MTTPQYVDPAGRLDPSDTLSKTFKTYSANVGTLLPIALVVYAIPSLVAFAGDSTSIALLIALVSAACGVLFTGIVVEVVRDVEDGTLDSSIGDLISSVSPLILPIIGLAILQAIAVTIGLVLIFIPGLFLLTIWAVAVPALILERRGVFASFGRSNSLVRGNGWQVFGVIFAVFVLNWVLRIVVVAIISPLGDAAAQIVAWLFSAAVAPIGAIVATVLYLRLRAIHGEEPLPTGAASAKGPLGR